VVPGRHVRPGRLRRRLAVAFVLVAGISAGALAIGSYVLVRQTRLADSLDRARTEARYDLVLAQSLLSQGPGGPAALLSAFEQRVHVVFISGDVQQPSNPSFDPPISQSLREIVATGQLAYDRLSSGGHHLLVVGGRIPGRSDELYLVFVEDRVASDLAQLRNVLAIGWVVVVLIAGLVGRTLAKRALGPVAQASDAARSIAEGLMATRLPVAGADEFGAWAASFNEMADALEAKIADLSQAEARERQFTADVAHELRTPLTALVGEASLLREHVAGMPEAARRPAELLIQDVARLRRLVEDLMEVSRFDAGSEAVLAEPVRLSDLADAVVRSRGWDGRVRIDGTAELRTDPRRVERIVANLVGNAIEHGGGSAEVRLASRNGFATIEVADHGPGIAPKDLGRIFDRFSKVDTSRTGTGSGLGLAIAREHARLLGGEIDVRSEPGSGTTFTVRLPVDESLHGGDRRDAGDPQDAWRHPDERGNA
jgi:two-component system, OmpR family, sensor histidine kinase MtrB